MRSAAQAGTFPTGEIVVESTFTDGTTRRQIIGAGP